MRGSCEGAAASAPPQPPQYRAPMPPNNGRLCFRLENSDDGAIHLRRAKRVPRAVDAGPFARCGAWCRRPGKAAVRPAACLHSRGPKSEDVGRGECIRRLSFAAVSSCDKPSTSGLGSSPPTRRRRCWSRARHVVWAFNWLQLITRIVNAIFNLSCANRRSCANIEQ
jgi:hypothetical protein